MNYQEIIRALQLSPHPEGGYFRETYRSAENIPAASLPARYNADRAISTAIYFLLTGESFSSFHRLRSDEIWHYYMGDPVELHLIHVDGRHEIAIIGPDLVAGQHPQFVIPAGAWFAARVVRADGFILIGCTVAPGFDFSDFELASRSELLQRFPQHADIIHHLTRTP